VRKRGAGSASTCVHRVDQIAVVAAVEFVETITVRKGVTRYSPSTVHAPSLVLIPLGSRTGLECLIPLLVFCDLGVSLCQSRRELLDL
jgi:hypothetical protein